MSALGFAVGGRRTEKPGFSAVVKKTISCFLGAMYVELENSYGSLVIIRHHAACNHERASTHKLIELTGHVFETLIYTKYIYYASCYLLVVSYYLTADRAG